MTQEPQSEFNQTEGSHQLTVQSLPLLV
jgi:hypothetical protein